MRIRIAVIASALLLAACPRPKLTPPPPPPPPLQDSRSVELEALQKDVKELSRQAEELLRAQQELIWKAWLEGGTPDIGKTYEGREPLFTLASIKKIERLRQLLTDAHELRALNQLHTFFVTEYLSSALFETDEAIGNLEASMTFTVEGKEYAYLELDRLLTNEKVTARRHALYDAATPLVQRLSQSIKRKDDKTRAVLQELGYPSYEAFGAELRQVNLDRLGQLADQLLQATQTPYVRVMAKLSDRELGLPLEKLRRSDLPRLFRRHGVDAAFPKDQLLPRAEATLKGLGIDLGSLKGYRLDVRDLPHKRARPITLRIDVPGDVRTSLKLVGGSRDQAQLLHELGKASLFIFSKETRFELAEIGGGAVPDAFGHLFEDLMEDPAWMEERAGLTGDKLEADLYTTAAYRLYLVRRAAGRLLYALQLQRGEGNPKALYSAVMARTYGIPMTPDDEERYLVDKEDFFESADSLQAWYLAAQLQAQLKFRFGNAWWHNPQAGDFLRFLWAKGNSLTAREVARMAGEESVKPDALLARLSATLKVPIPLPSLPREMPGANADGVPGPSLVAEVLAAPGAPKTLTPPLTAATEPAPASTAPAATPPAPAPTVTAPPSPAAPAPEAAPSLPASAPADPLAKPSPGLR